MIHLKKILVVSTLSAILCCFIKCTGFGTSGSNDPRGSQYAGNATCISCHQEIENAYVHNSHALTSAKADYNYLQHTLPNTANDTANFNDNQHVIVTRKGSAIHQVFYKDGQLMNDQKIDIAFGSAEKAQTYGYWKDNQLYQLPLSWLATQKIWTNSPGFPIDHPYYTRIIPTRCMECHTSFAYAKKEREGTQLQLKEVYDPSSIIYGIDCERCHGPGAQHAAFQQQHPESKEAKFITSIKSLSREQKLDLCGTCHAGDPVKLNSIFNFKPGDTLSNYYLFFNMGSGEPDVHGMQLQLLRLSKCFKNSQITCLSCHSPHAETQPDIISTCQSCHRQVVHTTDIQTQKANCINCHMPQRSSKALDFNNAIGTNNIRYLLRTHRIAVYPKNEWK